MANDGTDGNRAYQPTQPQAMIMTRTMKQLSYIQSDNELRAVVREELNFPTSGSPSQRFYDIIKVSSTPGRVPHSKDLHWKKNKHNNENDIPKSFKSWLCQLCLFWGEPPRPFYTSSSLKSIAEEGIQEGYPLKSSCKPAAVNNILWSDSEFYHPEANHVDGAVTLPPSITEPPNAHLNKSCDNEEHLLKSFNWKWWYSFCCFWGEEPKFHTSSNIKSINEKASQEEKPLCKPLNELGSYSDLYHFDTNDVSPVTPPTCKPRLSLCIPQVPTGDGPPKLHNFGNTCFFNAALQGIFSTSEFHNLYTTTPYSDMRTTAESTLNEDTYTKVYEVPSKSGDVPLHLTITSTPGPLTKAFNMLLQNVHETSPISPRDLLMELGKKNLRFTAGRQEDSHEVLRCIFDALKDEEILPVKRRIESIRINLDGEERMKYKGYVRMTSKIQTAIGQVIEGKIISVTICHECHDVSESVEPFFDISLPMPEENPISKDNFSPKNVNVMKDKINNQTQLTPLCTVSDDSEVTMECHSPCTCSGLSTTSDTVSAPYNDRLHYNDTQPNSTYVRLAPNTNPQTYSLPNPSISLTSTVPDNHYHRLKETEDGDPRQWRTVANNFTQHSPSTCQEKIWQNQQYQYRDYLVTHDKEHFQEYLIEKGQNHQLKSLRNRVDTDNLQFYLSMFTDLDVLDEDNKFICKACTTQKQLAGVVDGPALCRLSKQIMIHQLSPVLILHMKRFEISNDGVIKDNRHISFPEILDMAPYCTTKCIEDLGDANNRILYGLYAVVVHQGNSLQSGHYIAYVKTRPTKEKTPDIAEHGEYDERYCKKGQWHFTSDTYVRKCSLEEVKQSQAYMLFYERIPFMPVHGTMI